MFMDPVMIIRNHNSNHNLVFNKELHKYTIEDGVELTSVTTKLKDYFPFESEKIAKELSEIRGIPVESILEDWKKTADNGTAVHELAERYCKGEKLTQEELDKIKHVTNFIQDHPNFEILGCEVIVFSKKHSTAGTVDLMLKNKDNGKLYLLDWKTSNKEIEREEHWSMAKGKLNEIPHNKFHQYSMQVAMYMLILKLEYGIVIHDSIIVHLRDDKTYRVIEPTDLIVYAHEVLVA